jgi:IclR family mhp operon transcriptional activator
MIDHSEPVRPIRALLRGLEALRALNGQDGMTVTEVAERARVPRTTAYRILETLCQGGFVIRDEMDDRYRPTLAVTNLAEGAQN